MTKCKCKCVTGGVPCSTFWDKRRFHTSDVKVRETRERRGRRALGFSLLLLVSSSSGLCLCMSLETAVLSSRPCVPLAHLSLCVCERHREREREEEREREREREEESRESIRGIFAGSFSLALTKS